MASVGLSVVAIQRRRGDRRASWRRSDPATSRYNRRITATTRFLLAGPAVGDPRLQPTDDPDGRTVLGTLSNCSGGMTPWGTVLSGEENFDGYFDRSGELDSHYTASYVRYGINGRGRGWMEVAPRFDLSSEPHEPFRFGRIVEVDPFRPNSAPRKHTMLGRFKHEGANITIAESGHAVCYLGDDERGEYIYKFVSRDRFDASGTDAARRHNMTLLTRGTLYVARFTGNGTGDGVNDGTGDWLALTSHRRSYVDGMSVADVLIEHPARGGQAFAHSHGPARGHPAQPGQRQGLLRPDQQRETWLHPSRRRGEPGEREHGAGPPGRPAEACPRQPERLRARDQRVIERPHREAFPVEPHAGVRGPTGTGDVLRRLPQGTGECDQLSG